MGIRRQIYLDEADDRLLEEQSRGTGLSVSELVRRAIHRCYGADRTLTWGEVFTRTVLPNSAARDPWVYDVLFDAEVDELVERQLAEADE